MNKEMKNIYTATDRIKTGLDEALEGISALKNLHPVSADEALRTQLNVAGNFLSALVGWLTEEGTTSAQDKMLEELLQGSATPSPSVSRKKISGAIENVWSWIYLMRLKRTYTSDENTGPDPIEDLEFLRTVKDDAYISHIVQSAELELSLRT